MRKLYYFTTYYPARDVQWKTDELTIISKHFDLEVVPFEKKEFVHKADRIQRVIYRNPIFEQFPKKNIYIKFLSILLCKFVFRFMLEFFQKKVFLSKTKLILWTESAYKILLLSKNKPLKHLFKVADENTIFYFYWGRETSEAIAFLPKTKAKIIIRFHGYDLYEYRYIGNYIPFRTSQLKALNYAVFVSENGQEYMKTKYSSIKFNTFVSRLGTYSFGKAKQSEDGVFRIVSCSSVIPLKRVKLIAEALKLLKFNVEWTHIGAGSGFKQLQSFCDTIPENIIVRLVGQVPVSDVQKYYTGKAVDLFINVSTTEGLPVSVMEALAAGIPIMATDVGGTKELVTLNTGILLEKNISADKLANELFSFRNLKPEEKLNMRNKAFSVFEEKVNFESNCNVFNNFLKNL